MSKKNLTSGLAQPQRLRAFTPSSAHALAEDRPQVPILNAI